jgi:hypothetical protein
MELLPKKIGIFSIVVNVVSVEIDNVVAYVGTESFWQEIAIKKYGELFPRRDYRRSIDVPQHITPPELQSTIDLVRGQVKDILKPEYEKTMSKLKKFKGFIPDAALEENGIQCRMQEKLTESKRLSRYLEELETLRIKYSSK